MPDGLQLVNITHERCVEYAATTFVWAPADWSEERIRKAAQVAQAAYLEAYNYAVKNTEPPNDYHRYGGPRYESFPDKTVAEIKAEWEAKRVVWEAWDAQERAAKTSFLNFLTAQGFEPLHEHEDRGVELDWGHRHGVAIDYAETETDQMPTPRKLAGLPDEEEF